MGGTLSKHQQVVHHPVVQELYNWVKASPDRQKRFDRAILTATSQNVLEMQDIHSLSDWFGFLDSLQRWIPSETLNANEIFNRFSKLYFVLDQPSVFLYQSPVVPNSSKELSFVSQWIINFNVEFGTFMDTPASLTSTTLATFEASSAYRFSEYLAPRGGWRSFNEFFARHYKPGYRPIAAIEDSSVIVSPADFTFSGQLDISPSSTITAKGITWTINELMGDSPFKDRFKGGTWMHGYNATSDYHRIHTPVGGRVVETRIMSGQHYALIETMELEAEQPEPVQNGVKEKKKTLQKRRIFYTPNDPGYQFVQGRGLVVLDTDIGIVAVLPVGMAVISSVVLTAEMGVTLRKGEELGYFQFGGSDIVVMFESKRKVTLDAKTGMHYKMGVRLGTAEERT